MTPVPLPYALPVVCIGYVALEAFCAALDASRPVYLAPLVEPEGIGGYTVERHYVIATALDATHTIHYLRLVVMQRFHEEPPSAAQVAAVETVRHMVQNALERRGFRVVAGLVGLPVGVVLVNAEMPA
jgi:hypothetical protein